MAVDCPPAFPPSFLGTTEGVPIPGGPPEGKAIALVDTLLLEELLKDIRDDEARPFDKLWEEELAEVFGDAKEKDKQIE